MIVHFIAPKTNLDKEIKDFRSIIDAIHKRGYALALDWLEPAYMKLTHSRSKVMDWSKVCKANIEAIPKSDLVIAEISTKSFGVGYEVGLAASQKKPVLLLRRTGVSREAFLTGLDHPYVQKKEYDDTNLDKIIGRFLKENDIPSKDMRFNFFLDRKTHNYLQWASVQKGKTKAEILRELVMKEIEKDY